MFQDKYAAKYFKNLPHSNIRDESEGPASIKEMRYVLCQCRQDSDQQVIDTEEQISTQYKQEFFDTQRGPGMEYNRFFQDAAHWKWSSRARGLFALGDGKGRKMRRQQDQIISSALFTANILTICHSFTYSYDLQDGPQSSLPTDGHASFNTFHIEGADSWNQQDIVERREYDFRGQAKKDMVASTFSFLSCSLWNKSAAAS